MIQEYDTTETAHFSNLAAFGLFWSRLERQQAHFQAPEVPEIDADSTIDGGMMFHTDEIGGQICRSGPIYYEQKTAWIAADGDSWVDPEERR